MSCVHCVENRSGSVGSWIVHRQAEDSRTPPVRYGAGNERLREKHHRLACGASRKVRHEKC
eukprot:1460217-Amphidinium_carterae.2